ncbi:nucleotidyltransferase [Desulfallas sp. Bu1-1]|uniref:nucleotidyltransferase n=1 Tax=Desulfallas sp. Bu1-1 TaxID=2787620 RepID=UPI0018A08142|nr:nucleotidyltransferase [Desulfallas sp. Bu1-1]MBF7081869.1 nucleotidyltransferase [Desulfallas sp. Bu1-1]
MTKLYRQPIEAQIRGGRPVAFRWRRRWYQVISCVVHEDLPSRLEWWKVPGPTRYRCETRQGMVCDLIREGEGWVLERGWD